MKNRNQGNKCLTNKRESCSKSSPDAEPPSENEVPAAPDGGWGWVIVIVSFVCCAVVDGMCSVFGVLLPCLVYYFEESSAKTALAGSVLAGGFLLSGPVASAVVNYSSCRLATIIGGILACVAFVTCTFSPNVHVFIAIFGGLGGLGIGLIYLPASVMVGYYFEKRRAIAVGVSSAGAGVGMLILAPLAALLVDEYDWKGALIILAGVPLQCLICGALMRPLSYIPRTNSDDMLDYSPQARNSVSLYHEETGFAAFQKLPEIHEEICPNEETAALRESLNDVLQCKEEIPSPDVENSESTVGINIPTNGINIPWTDANRPNRIQVNGDTENSLLSSSLDAARTYDAAVVETRRRQSTSNCSLSSKYSNVPPRSKKVSESQSNVSDDMYSDAANRVESTTDVGYLKARKSVSSVHVEQTLSPLLKKDIFYSGSVSSLQRWNQSKAVLSLESIKEDVGSDRGKHSQAMAIIQEMLDIAIFKNCSFLVICAASIFIQLGYFVPMVFLSAYAQTLDISSSKAAFILSVIGISNMIGRAGAGALANIRCVNILHLNNIALVVAGVATVFVVVLCKTFTALIVYAVIFGLCVAVFVPVTTMFLVKYVGLNKLTNAYGLLSMVKGLASMVGPPVAGALLDATQTYNSTFYFAGAMFICAGFVFYILPFTQSAPLLQECRIVHVSDSFDKPQSPDDTSVA